MFEVVSPGAVVVVEVSHGGVAVFVPCEAFDLHLGGYLFGEHGDRCFSEAVGAELVEWPPGFTCTVLVIEAALVAHVAESFSEVARGVVLVFMEVFEESCGLAVDGDVFGAADFFVVDLQELLVFCVFEVL